MLSFKNDKLCGIEVLLCPKLIVLSITDTSEEKENLSINNTSKMHHF